jgi:hypothetical protein
MRITNWATRTAAISLSSLMIVSTAYAEGSGGLLGPLADKLGAGGEGYDLSDSILGPDSAWDFGGWVAVGGSTNNTGVFNDSGFGLTQGWIYIEKTMNTENGFDWGFRGDLMVGQDGPNTQAFGNDFDTYDFADATTWDKGYGLAAPQLYVELGYEDISVKGGHFYTLVGYEVVPSPGNFFYSHAFTMNFSEPFTHTGVVATYSGLDNVEVYAGWTAGWDTGFQQNMGGSSFLGGASLQLTDNTSLAYIATAGNLGWIGDDGYTHSIVVDTSLTDKLNYVIQSDYVNVKDSVNALPLNPGGKYKTVGVNQYMFYTVNESVALGARAEWWRANSVDFYEVTAGVNLQLLPNLKTRPEFRYQFSPDVDNGSANQFNIPVDQGIFGIDFIWEF